jgi:hypothetical protein
MADSLLEPGEITGPNQVTKVLGLCLIGRDRTSGVDVTKHSAVKKYDARKSGGTMKTAALIFSGLVLAWAAYTLGPDLRRYARMRAM